MCGIAGFMIHEDNRMDLNITELAQDLLFGIDHRGGDACGYSAFTWDGQVQTQKAACSMKDFLFGMKKLPENTRTVLLHTRMATQGHEAFPENNHPVVTGTVHVVHNGHIFNDREIFRDSKVERQGAVDSEAISAAIHYHGWKHLVKALESLDGTFAVGAVDQTMPKVLWLAKGDWAPIHVITSKKLTVFASTQNSIREAWRRNIGKAPKDNKFSELISGDLYAYGPEGFCGKKRFHVRKDDRVFRTSHASYTGPICTVPVKETKSTEVVPYTSTDIVPDKIWTPEKKNGWWDDDGFDIVKCEGCDEWEDIDLMNEWAGALVCDSCAKEFGIEDEVRAAR